MVVILWHRDQGIARDNIKQSPKVSISLVLQHTNLCLGYRLLNIYQYFIHSADIGWSYQGS